ncbi:MAG: DUF3604 domain-containing protein, partial [Anaerolineaceae bacterium]|nr:DUF3604 domain-containing protein [Anaerolineaceae bacterium]
MQQFNLGTASIQPNTPAIAGAFTSITFTYTAGHPIDDSGYLKIVFRRVGDYGTPQFDRPSAPNYCTISTDGDCRIQPRWDPFGHTRPWSRALFLQIRGGYLDKGKHITVTFGDQSSGSQGWQLPTFCVSRFEFKTLVDPIATYQFKELPSSPFLKIIPGPPTRAVCIAPSQVEVNRPFDYYLKLEDRWGNPIAQPQKLSHPGIPDAGIHYLSVEDLKTGLSARSNPIRIVKQKSHLHPYWADFHGQSGETVGSGSIEEYFNFGRNYALLDILGHQGNDFQITDEFWEKINRISHDYYQPGKFVPFPGYEYSANTPLGGDRNVYFTSEGGRISRSSCELLPNNFSLYPDSPTAADLFTNLRMQKDATPFVFAHVGGRYADISTHDEDLELAVEVHSAWGTFEWLVNDALSRGYYVGICANSDGHKCRPGASYPGASTFGSYGGLTCVLAEALDRKSIYHALKARHFYATTGARMLVALTLVSDDGVHLIMGDKAAQISEHPTLNCSISGTAPIEKVDIINGSKIIDTFRPYKEADLGNRIKILWSGAEVRGRDRKVSWDGTLEIAGNKILHAEPINFWNIDKPLILQDNRHIS